jgi:hypothetical protein
MNRTDLQTAFVIAARKNEVARMHAIALAGIDLAAPATDEESACNEPITALQAAVVSNFSSRLCSCRQC